MNIEDLKKHINKKNIIKLLAIGLIKKLVVFLVIFFICNDSKAEQLQKNITININLKENTI